MPEPQSPTPPSDTAIPTTRHPTSPLPRRGAAVFTPSLPGTAGQGPPALPSPTAGRGSPPAGLHPTERGGVAMEKAAPRPAAPRPAPTAAAPPELRRPQPLSADAGPHSRRASGGGYGRDRREARSPRNGQSDPDPRRAARRGSLTERTRTRYLPALRGAEPARPLPTMGRGRPAPPRSAAPPLPAR